MRYGCSVPCNSLDYKSGCTVPIVQQDINVLRACYGLARLWAYCAPMGAVCAVL